MADDALDALAARAAGDPFFLASLLAAYARSEELDDAGLATALGCPVTELAMIRLCRVPRTDPKEFWEDVHQVAGRFGLNADRLAEVVRRGRVVTRLREAQPSPEGGYLMAARDAEEEEAPPEEPLGGP
jgi:hypothetical protein